MMNFRPFKKSDAEYLVKWSQDPAYDSFYRRFFIMPTWEEFENLPQLTNSLLMMVEINDEIVGLVKADRFDNRSRTCTAGLLIVKDYQGKGLGFKVYSEWCNYLINTLNIRKIIAEPIDESMIKLAIKCGFEKEGVLKKQCYIRGQYVDETILALIKE